MKRLDPPPAILAIEDEPGIAVAVYNSLTKEGYRVETAKTGNSGLRKAGQRQFDLIILDLGLPDINGLTVCKQLRALEFNRPIIILTAESAIKSKVTLLDAGADDYLTKPFSLEELKARVRAALRPQRGNNGDLRVVGGLTLNRRNRLVTRGNRPVALSRKEYAILECLVDHANTVVTRAGLATAGWETGEEAWTNTIDVHIKHLRDKIDRPFGRPIIQTVHGLGYKLVPDVDNIKLNGKEQI